MIRINFATRKRSSAAGPSEKGKGIPKIDLSSLKDLPLKKYVVAAVACGLGYWLLEDYKETQLAALEPVMQKLNAESSRLQAEIGKTKGFEQVKGQLEKDEFAIKTKIETIEKLVADRTDAYSMLINFSEIMPAEVWLSDFNIKGGQVKIKGSSFGYNPISDFMKRLSESAYVTDLALLSTSQRAERRGAEIADFELSAKRRAAF